MKRWLIVLVLVGLVGLVGCAGEAEARGDVCDSFLSSVLNECHKVAHPTADKVSAELGVGLDLILYEGKEGQLLNKVTGEYRYDINNSTHQSYAVATSKLTDIWTAIKSLFGR